MIDNFVFPSDQDRAENDELDRVCEALEAAIERIDVQNKRLDAASQQEILDGSDHIPDATKMVRGDVVAMGELTDNDDNICSPAMLVQFASVEDFQAARAAGQCQLSVFGGDA